MYDKAFKKADAIMTVSEYSKKEILDNYRLKNKDIVVAGNGWQHFNIDYVDEGIFDRYASRGVSITSILLLLRLTKISAGYLKMQDGTRRLHMLLQDVH